MITFEDLNLGNPLMNALNDLGYKTPTPIQEQVYSTILAGRDVVGIAQTGTGKTFAYILPILRHLKYSEQKHPRILVLVPTRELVVQVCGEIEKLSTYTSVRIKGVYGGTNINTQKQNVYDGCDILVATPGRLLDLALSGTLRLKSIQKLVIDEVDEMLNLGFRTQLTNLLDILPERRQNLLFSATMTSEVEDLFETFFDRPERFLVVPTGTPLENIEQAVYHVPNYNTKVNLLHHLVQQEELSKILLFVESKRLADKLEEGLSELYPDKIGVIHSNKSQNYRLRSVEQFDNGEYRILIATDLIARGIDFEGVSHVINFDTPEFAENYLHRIGRTGRAEAKGTAITFVSAVEVSAEREYLEAIEQLMSYSIPTMDIPETVTISHELTPEEQFNPADKNYLPEETRRGVREEVHEKKTKNQKTNQGGSYRRKIKAKYKKPKTRGQKPRGKKR